MQIHFFAVVHCVVATGVVFVAVVVVVAVVVSIQRCCHYH